MSRLIDADALKDELNAWARVIMKPTLMGSDEVMCVIDHAPTIDAVPVVHGEWLPSRPDAPMFGFHYCSKCGRKRTSPQDNYCPNCGAEMYGEEQDDE